MNRLKAAIIRQYEDESDFHIEVNFSSSFLLYVIKPCHPKITSLHSLSSINSVIKGGFLSMTYANSKLRSFPVIIAYKVTCELRHKRYYRLSIIQVFI